MRTPSTTASDFDSCRGITTWIRAATIVLPVVLAISLAAASHARASTTHPFLTDIAIPGVAEAEPLDVDSDGNLLVWLGQEHAIGKYDASGNPVDFSGLGSNILDGIGEFDCPNTPSDCDQVPTVPGVKGFEELSPGGEGERVVAVDNSGGPADGHIYVTLRTEVAVFDAGGQYLGKLDMSGVGPTTLFVPGISNAGGRIGGISISSTGIIYLLYSGAPGGSHVDAFAPVDAIPAHDQFIGQMAPGPDPDEPFFPALIYDNLVAGTSGIYVGGGNLIFNGVFWFKYSLSEFARRGPRNQTFASPIDLSNGTAPTYSLGTAPFGNAGATGCCGARGITLIDPANEDVYLGYSGGDLQQWSSSNQKIGPNFGEGHVRGHTMALDRSGGPDDGHIYVGGASGQNSISVFGPPVTIPDITMHPEGIGHYDAHLSATIGRAGGPNVTSCELEYGPPNVFGTYETSVPCDDPLPYTGDTEIEIDLAGLTVEADYHYRIKAGNANGMNISDEHLFHTNAVLDVTTEAASTLGRTTADLNGSLNPDGMTTEYRFEWGASTQYGQSTPWTPAPGGSSSVSVPPVTIENLQSGRTFHYRLVAQNSLGTSYGDDMTFTVPRAPRILSVTPKNITATTADMTARINPSGFDTTYHFEYGETASYGQSTPETPLGAGITDQTVSEALTGLQSGVTYHFRVVATNEWGTSTSGNSTIDFLPPNCPNSHIRQELGASYLPDCRAWELVSPEDAGGAVLFAGSVAYGAGNLQVAARLSPQNPRGSAMTPSRFGFFGGFGAIPGLNPPNAIIDRYVASRSSTGWKTTYPGRPADQALLVVAPRCNATLSRCTDIDPGDLIYSGTPGSTAPFMWDLDGNFLGRLPTNYQEIPNADPAIASDALTQDFSDYIFASRLAAFAPGGLETRPGSVYDNDIDTGTVEIVSKLASGEPIPRDTGNNSEVMKIPAISDDGSHVLMSVVASGGNTRLYMRVNGTITYYLTPVAGVKFVAMTRTGGKVFFTSTAAFLPEDTDTSADLYMWSEATDSVALVSQGHGQGNSDSCSATWISGCGVATLTTERPALDNLVAGNAGDIYFYSPEQLDADNPGVRNERNLYVYRNGDVQYVTTLDPGTQIERMQISPDGNHAAFITRSQVTGYDNNGWAQMYTLDPNTGQIECASCLPSGDPPQIGYLRPVSGSTEMIRHVVGSQSGPFMTEDGRVAFTTADALVAADTNNAPDVYEYVNSRPQLISGALETRYYYPGASFLFRALNVGFEGFSANGVDLYFSTYETLVPQDRNGRFVKFYDARVGGGFPVAKGLLPCTAADECHGDSSTAPAPLEVGSGAPLGAGGNVKSTNKRRTAKRKAKKAKARKKHRHAQSTRRGGNG